MKTKAGQDTFSIKVPVSASVAAELGAKVAQAKHRLRWVRQKVASSAMAVVGGYHQGNLGDMALAASVARRIAGSKRSYGVQTIYNLARWPKAETAIVGGGAVGYSDCLRQLAEGYGKKPENVAILGVDFNDPGAICAYADFLKRVPIITCRSARQAANVSQLLGRNDIAWHQDLCFSLYDETRTERKTSGSTRTLGINSVPLFLKQINGQFVTGSNHIDELQREHPDLVPQLDKLSIQYCNLVRDICRQAKRAGMRVKHIPFTPLDDMFARTVLHGLGVEFAPYTSNVSSVLSQVGRCERFFTTRFHSLVFSILNHCQAIPFCYASKCDRLLEDFGVTGPPVIRLADILDYKQGMIERILEGPGIQITREKINEAHHQVCSIIDNAIACLVLPRTPRQQQSSEYAA